MQVVEARVDRFEAMLKQMAEDGPPLPGTKQPPAERLRQYLAGTLPEEIDLVMDVDYEVKASLGVYPVLQSPFWGLLLTLPKFKSGWSPFVEHQNEFRQLLLTLDKRMEGSVATDRDSAVAPRSGY